MSLIKDIQPRKCDAHGCDKNNVTDTNRWWVVLSCSVGVMVVPASLFRAGTSRAWIPEAWVPGWNAGGLQELDACGEEHAGQLVAKALAGIETRKHDV